MTQPQPGSLGAAHLAGRLAVTADDAQHDGWGGMPVPGHLLAMHQVWGSLYAELLADGDTGAAFSHLHQLRYDEPDVDPWRLLEHAVRRALAYRHAAAAGQETAAPAGGAGPAVPPAPAAVN